MDRSQRTGWENPYRSPQDAWRHRGPAADERITLRTVAGWAVCILGAVLCVALTGRLIEGGGTWFNIVVALPVVLMLPMLVIRLCAALTADPPSSSQQRQAAS